MAGIAYYDKSEVFIDGKQIGTALDLGIEFKHNAKRTRDEAIRNLAPFADPKPLPKPSRVEKWQRWHQTGFGVRVVAALECGDKLAKFRDGGAQLCRMITENTMMEYLGMAESAQDDWKTATGEALDREAKRNGFVRSIGETDEKLRARFASPADPKAEARRANEEAAKRLIANPPEWAYPKAWMCAVLAAQEWNNSHTIVPGMELSSIGWWIAVVCELEHRGRERTATIDGIETVIRDAYARGMARSSPMTRPGVKGGISTCDLGGEYE